MHIDMGWSLPEVLKNAFLRTTQYAKMEKRVPLRRQIEDETAELLEAKREIFVLIPFLPL